MRADHLRRPYNSEARIDALAMTLAVDLPTLESQLGPLDLRLGPIEGFPSGQHPVCVEVWRVKGGTISLQNGDAHAWFARAAAAPVLLGGALWNAGLSAVTGVRARVASNARAETARWSEAAGRLGRRWSEMVSAVAGTYNEVVIGIPEVAAVGQEGRAFFFVLGMYSDSPIAIWGDRAMRCGYRKAAAAITLDELRAFDVRPARGNGKLSGTYEPAPDSSTAPDGDVPISALWKAWLAQPWLGHLSDRTFAVTFVDRQLSDPEVRVRSASGTLEVVEGATHGLRSGRYRVEPLSTACRYGAFQVSDLPVKVTFPAHVTGRQ